MVRLTIVDDNFDTLEIQPTGHKLGNDQHPRLALSKISNRLFSLRLCSIRVNHPHAQAIHHEFLVQVVCSLDGLNEDESWRREVTFGDVVSQRHELADFRSAELEFLLDCRCGRIPEEQ